MPAQLASAADGGGFPALGQNKAEALASRRTPVSDTALAKQVAEDHRQALRSRRKRDLTAEKYLIHIDGEGDAQWADILYDSRVEIPRGLNEFRRTENLLRPIIDNAVAYHTTMPFRFVAEFNHSRESREKAKLDAAVVNHVVRQQKWNGLAAEAMYLSMAAGFCPLHAYWRDDPNSEYEPINYTPEQVYEMGGMAPTKGLIDCFVGNPFATTFNPGARRGSFQSATYERVLPAKMVEAAFGVKVEGSNRLPSASVYQRIARKWLSQSLGLGVHGTSVLEGGRDTGEELVSVICREIAPGIDPEWPNGRLTCIALKGTADSRSDAKGAEAVLLADQELPAGRFSFVNVYSHHRFDDVHGKGFAGDLDDLQVDLNVALSDRRSYVKRMLDAPTITGGALIEDTAEYNGFTILEMEPGSTIQPKVLEIHAAVVNALDTEIAEIRQAMYTLGGYQAASRGESNSGDAYRKVVALAQQDDSIHGATNGRFRDDMNSYAQLAWSLFKTYGDVGWLVDAAGEDFAYLAEGYIDNTKISDTPPTFRMTQAAGTPESYTQTLLDYVTSAGADQQPIMSTAEFREKHPGDLFDSDNDPSGMARRRARTVAQEIKRVAERMRRENGVQDEEMASPNVQTLAMWVFQEIEQRFPRLRDDDLNAHIAAYSEIAQDETEDAVARAAAIQRQDLYYEWQAQMAMAGQPMPQQPQGQPAAPVGPQEDSMDAGYIAAEMQGGSPQQVMA